MNTGPWAPEQDEKLRTLRRAGLEYSEIGAVIGRSTKGCVHRARVLELPKRERQEHVKAGPLPWSEFDAPPVQQPLPPDPEFAREGTEAMPPGCSITWNAITRGTCLEGTPYPREGR